MKRSKKKKLNRDKNKPMLYVEQELIPGPQQGQMMAKRLRLLEGKIVISERDEEKGTLDLSHLAKRVGRLLTVVEPATETTKLFRITGYDKEKGVNVVPVEEE